MVELLLEHLAATREMQEDKRAPASRRSGDAVWAAGSQKITDAGNTRWGRGFYICGGGDAPPT